MKSYSCPKTTQCAREHFSYCAAAHPRSLEGTLLKEEALDRTPENSLWNWLLTCKRDCDDDDSDHNDDDDDEQHW
jgi:hypothetical protein